MKICNFKDWLLSAICDYNDLPRILDVLLVSLLHPSTARVSVQQFINKILIMMPAASYHGGSPSKQVNFGAHSIYEDGDTSLDNSDNIRLYESKVYAISNEGGQVRYHVNGAPMSSSVSTPAKTPTTDAQQAGQNKMLLMPHADQSSSSGSLIKPAQKNMELPILNAASLGASGISLRINPFMMAKNGSQAVGSGLELGDSLASDDFADTNNNDLDESTKNARLLENYKAIKVGQIQKEKERQLLR